LISELSATEFHPENYEDEYRKRVLKAIEQKVAGQEIERVEVAARPPTTDLVTTLKASLGRKDVSKATGTSESFNRVLVLSASAGAGHLRAAQALERALVATGPPRWHQRPPGGASARRGPSPPAATVS
jgi:DNA end-binding protein Ku